MPRATGRGATRAGLTEDELVDDVAALLEIGHERRHHVHRPLRTRGPSEPSNRARVLEACKQGNSSVWATGSDPGFVTETLPLALLSMQRRVD